jgi:hypothetical protein
MGMLMLLFKCCGALTNGAINLTQSNEVDPPAMPPAAPNTISPDLIAELERIFEGIEEGRVDEEMD